MTNAKRLPPDPERMNDNRATWAKIALIAFMVETGTDLQDALADLLADLMHWCDRNGVKFYQELQRGCFHYHEETADEGQLDANKGEDL